MISRDRIVHARMLAAGGILSQADATQIIAGLEDVAQTIAEDRFEWSVAARRRAYEYRARAG